MLNYDPMTDAQKMFTETKMIAQRASLGLLISVDPDIADHMGAFDEKALDVDDADDSRFDVDLDTGILLDDNIEGGA